MALIFLVISQTYAVGMPELVRVNAGCSYLIRPMRTPVLQNHSWSFVHYSKHSGLTQDYCVHIGMPLPFDQHVSNQFIYLQKLNIQRSLGYKQLRVNKFIFFLNNCSNYGKLSALTFLFSHLKRFFFIIEQNHLNNVVCLLLLRLKYQLQ